MNVPFVPLFMLALLAADDYEDKTAIFHTVL